MNQFLLPYIHDVLRPYHSMSKCSVSLSSKCILMYCMVRVTSPDKLKTVRSWEPPIEGRWARPDNHSCRPWAFDITSETHCRKPTMIQESFQMNLHFTTAMHTWMKEASSQATISASCLQICQSSATTDVSSCTKHCLLKYSDLWI